MRTTLLGNRLGRWLGGAALVLLANVSAQAQLTGAKAIPGTGSTGYATLAAAITDLNTQGVGAGGVTFNLAAGYTETAANLLIIATGTAANPIVFQKAGTGTNPLITNGVGATTTLDFVIGLSGSDYVTIDGIDVAENVANTTATTQAEFGIVLFRASATDGCQFNTIRNCVVTLNKTNAATIGIYGAPNTVAATTGVGATATTGANSGNRVYGNVVTNSQTGIYFLAAVPAAVANYDQNNEVGSIISPATVATGNTVGNFGSTGTGYGVAGSYQNGYKIQGNTLNNALNYTSATTSTAVAATTVTGATYGIYTPTGTSSNLDIVGNSLNLVSGGTTASLYGVYNGMGSTPTSNTVNINNNSLAMAYASATSATIYGFYNFGSPATMNLNGNRFNSLTTPTTGTAYLLYNSSSSSAITATNNQVGNITRTGASGTTYGYYNFGGGSGTQTLTGNVFNNITLSSGTFYMYYSGSSTETELWSGNQATNITLSSTSTLYGIYLSAAATNSQVFNNTVTGLTGGGSVYGLYLGGSGTLAAYGNTVGNISSASTTYGVYTFATTPNIYRNKVYGLSNTSTAGTTYGVYTAGGTTVTIYNNLIGDLTASTSTNLNAVAGLYFSTGTAINAYYNTINLAATSSGATFGTSGIYFTTTPTTVDLRNNIVVNKSTAVGTGGYTAALRGASGTAGTVPALLATTSNNNLYYAGTPSATNLIYVEGTTTATNAQQTLATYKAFAGTRETASVTEDVPFVSTTGTAATFLHISTTTPTQVESAGTPIAGITTDYDGDTRNTSTPDIGADEGTFIGLDLTAPSIVYAALSSTATTTNRTLTVTITDASGVATGANAPRLFYRKGTTGTYVSVLATSVSGSTYTFTIDYTAVGGVTNGDVIQYYVAAQDLAATPNSGTSPVGGTYATAPTTPNSYAILNSLSGIYYVGTSTSPNASRTYPTLTAAATAYNTSGLAGAVTFLLLDNTYSTAETFPIIFQKNGDASATNTLTIRPNAGVTASAITSPAAATTTIQINGASYITLDGANTTGGTTRNLSITNASTTGGAAVQLISLGVGLGATNDVVRNLNLATASTTAGIAVSVGNATVGGAGADNDNVTIQNNNITPAYVGIYAGGTAAVSAGGLDGLVITGNTIGGATAGAGNIGNVGTFVANAVAPNVSTNTIQNLNGTTITGMSFPTGVVNGTISQNTVQALTSSGLVYGIYFAGTGSTGNTLIQNTIQNLTGTSTSVVYGVYFSGTTLTGNTITRNLVQTVAGTGNAIGLFLGAGFTGGTATRNQILGITSTGTGGYGGKGIDVQTGSTTSALLVANNFIQITAGSGWTVLTSDANVGIRLGTGGTLGGVNVYYNSVNMTGTEFYNGLTVSAALYVGSGTSTVDIRNNILRNSIVNSANTGAKAYAFNSAAANTAFTNLDYNDYFVSGSQGVLGYLGADLATLAAIRTATGKDANSLNTDPLFQTATDLHSPSVSLNNVGTPIAAVTDDIDGDPRSATTPDIGADEFTPQAVDIAASALIAPAQPNATTGTCYGSAEAVTVQVRNAGTTILNFANNPLTVTVVVTGPGTPGTLAPYTVSTGTLAVGATLNVTLPSTVNLSALGTYSFAVTATVTGDGNASNNTLSQTPAVTVSAPVAGTLSPASVGICVSGTTTLTLAGYANGTIQYQSSSSATGPFTNITGATSATFTTPVLNTTTYYRAQVTCGSNTVTSGVSAVTVSNPLIASVVTPVSACVGGTATLSATVAAGSGTSVRFFATATGGTALTGATTTGNTTTATTPALTATTTYYAEAYTGSTEMVGKPSTNGADATNTAGGLYFTATTSTTIQNVTVYRTANAAAGTATIQLLSGSTTTGTPLAQVTVAVPANTTATVSPATLTLNFAVPAAGSYTLYLSAATPNLCRDFSGGASLPTTAFPYTSPSGTVSITNGTLAGYYYFFYNWQIGGECANPTRTAIQVNVAPNPTTTFSYPTTAACAGTATTLTPTLATGATAGTFTLPAATGLTINATTGVVTVAATAVAGTYTVTNTTTNTCGTAVTSTATFTIAPAVTSTFSYAGSPFCANGINPTPTITGTAGGTFSSTTGLTINATTGVINLSGSTPGTYTVTYTATGCGTSTSTQTVTITAPQTAGFAYVPASGCAGSTTTVSPTLLSGGTAGTFTVTPATGLTINATTGVITLSSSAAGTYTVTNTVAASGGCASASNSATFTVNPAVTSTFSYAGSPFCANGTNPTPTITGTAGGTLSSTTGLTINATTGVINLSGSTPGTYTVTYTATGTCGTSTSTQAVTITAQPTAGFTYLPISGCAGSTTTVSPTLLSGGTAGTFTVTPTTGLTINATTGVITLSSSAAGTYTVTNTVAASGGCAAVTSTATFTVAPAPATPTLGVTGTPATGITLTSSSATGNQFYLNNVLIAGATGQTLLVNSGQNNGAYTVTVTNASGCSATSAPVTVTVTATTPGARATSLSVYPNPTRDGLLTLELSGYQETVQLSIVNALGQRVYEGTVSGSGLSQKQALNLSGLATGVYTLQARTASGSVEIRRLVRE